MQNFTRNLLTEWRKLDLPFADQTFVVAVSGGADSLSLALALRDLRERKKLNLRFVVAHFNHNLRGAASAADEEFVKFFAERHNFELALGRGEIAAKKGNLEQTARLARYEFLRETNENLRADGVLTAHTVNDQAETFLLNLIRGSGVSGLSGMKPISFLHTEKHLRSIDAAPEVEQTKGENIDGKKKIRLIRPLLNWAKRGETENFCRVNSVEYRSDAMNEDLTFKRVRIRRVLLPLLQDFNPQIIEKLATTAGLLRDEFAEFEGDLAEAEREELKIQNLKSLLPAQRRRFLRAWLAARRGNLRQLSFKHIDAVERLIFSEKSGRVSELPGGETVVKKSGKLIFNKN